MNMLLPLPSPHCSRIMDPNKRLLEAAWTMDINMDSGCSIEYRHLHGHLWLTQTMDTNTDPSYSRTMDLVMALGGSMDQTSS